MGANYSRGNNLRRGQSRRMRPIGGERVELWFQSKMTAVRATASICVLQFPCALVKDHLPLTPDAAQHDPFRRRPPVDSHRLSAASGERFLLRGGRSVLVW